MLPEQRVIKESLNGPSSAFCEFDIPSSVLGDAFSILLSNARFVLFAFFRLEALRAATHIVHKGSSGFDTCLFAGSITTGTQVITRPVVSSVGVMDYEGTAVVSHELHYYSNAVVVTSGEQQVHD